MERWFREDLREFASDLLLSQRFKERGLFQPKFVEDLIKAHVSRQRSGHYHIWNLLMLESWFRMFIDERPRQAQRAPSPLLVNSA